MEKDWEGTEYRDDEMSDDDDAFLGEESDEI